MRIAVLDDRRSQSDVVCQVLTAAGHGCHAFDNGKDIVSHLRREGVEMLIIDWQVAGLGGAEVLRWAREKLVPNLPVLLMTSLSGSNDIVAGLTAGANDYLVKPIRRGELVARVQALLQRAYPSQTAIEQIVFGRYVFESRQARLFISGALIDVTQKEFDLALLFFSNLGRPLSRAYILEAVWSRDGEIPSRTMDTHVSRVRSKLQLRPENGFRLAPVYSYGYQLEQLGAIVPV